MGARSGAGVVLGVMVGVHASARDAWAGGGWVPAPGAGYVNLAFVDKVSSSGWDANGRSTFAGDGATSRDDLKFIALSGEVGLVSGVSLLLVVPFLYGREGRTDPLDSGAGFSDLFIGGKIAVLEGVNAVAASVVARTPWLYDRGGAYRRFDSAADQADHKLSSQWRGLLKYDLAFTVHGSRSFASGRGWATIEPGVVFRTGAPSHAFAAGGEVGYAFFESIPLAAKLYTYLSLSLHTDREPREDDRFPSTTVYNFNDASMWKIGASLLWRPWLGLFVEAGYGRWIWGRSARKYEEPFVSIGWML
jgi:hypothetical protein